MGANQKDPTFAEPSPLNDIRFRQFASGNAINNFGETAFVGVAPLLLAQSHGNAATATSVIATALSGLLSPYIGAAIDRYGWRSFYYAGITMQALSIAALTLLFRLEDSQLLIIGLLLVINQIGGTSYLSAWKVGLNELFPSFRRRARGSLNTIFYAAGIAGPLIAYALIEIGGITAFMLFNTLTFLAPILALRATDRAGRYPPKDRPRLSVSSTLISGMSYIFGSAPLRRLLLLRCFASALPPTLVGAIIVIRFEQLNAAPLVIIAIANLMVYVGNQYVSRLSDFPEIRIVGTYIVLGVIGTLILNVKNDLVFVMGICIFAISSGIGLSHFVLASVVYSPNEIYGSISGVIGLASSIVGLFTGTLLATVDAIGITSLFVALAVLALGAAGAGVHYVRAPEVRRAEQNS